MKFCPACRTTFDDSQNFCLNDGTPLVAAESEPETVVAPREQNINQSGYQSIPPLVRPQTVPAKSNTGLIVAATALVTILLVGVVTGGWWLLSRDKPDSNINVNAPTNTARTSPTIANTPANVNQPTNANETKNTSLVLPTNTNLAVSSPTPAQQLSASDAATIRQEAASTLNSWKSALESNDVDSYMSYYAPTLDYYYNSRGYSKNQVRADKMRAFRLFTDMQVNVSNLRVTPDASGDKATVVYDKEWIFEGSDKTNEGKVQSQMTLQKIGGRWLITGERDLKVYYSRSY